MDGRTTFHKLQEMLKHVSGEKIKLSKLRTLIIMNIGSSERTIHSCLKIMEETKMIKDLGNTKFKVLQTKL